MARKLSDLGIAERRVMRLLLDAGDWLSLHRGDGHAAARLVEDGFAERLRGKGARSNCEFRITEKGRQLYGEAKGAA